MNGSPRFSNLPEEKDPATLKDWEESISSIFHGMYNLEEEWVRSLRNPYFTRS